MTLGPLMIDLEGTVLQPEERELLAHPSVGSVILFARNYAEPEQLTRLVADIHAVRSPALIVGVDHEGGRVQRFRAGFSKLPPLRRIGHEHDADPQAGAATLDGSQRRSLGRRCALGDLDEEGGADPLRTLKEWSPRTASPAAPRSSRPGRRRRRRGAR